MDGLTVIAVDWSGRAGADQVHAIRAAVVPPGGPVEVWADLRREDVVDELLAIGGPVVVGFDFSFGFPAWVGGRHGCTSGPELWPLVARDGEDWIARCPPPFYGRAGTRAPAVPLRRVTEQEAGAKPTFLLAGGGHVGTGSLRGMPFLAALRAAGYAVWPFDDAAGRTAVEIYPTALRAAAGAPELPRRVARAVANSPDTRDAVLSAVVMARHRARLASLRAATDPVTRLEGAIWRPDAPAGP